MNKECYLKGIRLLTQKEYSRPKLKQKLKNSGFEQEDVDQCVDQLYAKGLLKEDWYIEGRIKSLMRKGYSPSHIQKRLSYEELDIEIERIGQVFTDFGQQDESQQIANFISKKANRFLANWTETSFEERQKIMARLVRGLVAKGHSPSSGLKAVESFFHDN